MIRRVVPLLVVALWSWPAQADPKCIVVEHELRAVSRDGRYALTTETDHFGLIDVYLTDFQSDAIMLHGRMLESVFEEALADETLYAVGTVKLQPVSVWRPLNGSFQAVGKRVAKRCGPLVIPEAYARSLTRRDFRRAFLGTKYIVMVFDLGEADGCDSTTGEQIIGQSCEPVAVRTPLEDQAPQSSAELEQIRATVAAEAYHRQHDPLRAYFRLEAAWVGYRNQPLPLSIHLAILGDQTLYLSRLGWLGRQMCAEIQQTYQYLVSKTQPAVEDARLRQAVEHNLRKCAGAAKTDPPTP